MPLAWVCLLVPADSDSHDGASLHLAVSSTLAKSAAAACGITGAAAGCDPGVKGAMLTERLRRHGSALDGKACSHEAPSP